MRAVSFFSELKRRNVFKVATAYIIIGWLIMQAGDTLAPALHLPGWINSALAFFLILGFPLAVFFAWAFEMTPEGLRKEKDVDPHRSISRVTGRKLDFVIIALMAAGLAYFAWDKFVVVPPTGSDFTQGSSQAAPVSTAMAPEAGHNQNKSIAVLPFVNMSDDGANEYFADGLSEELLNLLAKIPELKVAARTSSFQFKGHTGDIAAIAAQLKVTSILEGSVRKSGDQIRVTAQLIKADDGYHLWSETYDRTLQNIFDVQDEIAAAVVDALKITLLGAVPVAKEVNPDAYALFLQGRYYYDQKNEQSSHKAVEAYQQALQIDPEYAAALAGLALTTAWQAGYDYIDYEAGVASALANAEKSVRLDPELALAWISLSYIQNAYLWQWQASYDSAQKALELDPTNSTVMTIAAEIIRDLGQLDQSLSMFQKAVELDPLNLTAINQLARAYAAAERFEESEQQYLNLLSLNPSFNGAHSQYAYTLLLAGRYQDALSEAKKDNEIIWSSLLQIFALHSLGKTEEAEAGLEAFIAAHQDFWAYQIAEVYAWRDEADEAFKWLDAALQYRDPGLGNLLTDQFLRNLHDDPRWGSFLDKVGLLQAWQAMPASHKGNRQ